MAGLVAVERGVQVGSGRAVIRDVVRVGAAAFAWAVIAALLQSQVIDPVTRGLYRWIAPPFEWYYSWVPWPQSFASLLVFALIAGAFVALCSRAGLGPGLAAAAVLLGVVVLLLAGLDAWRTAPLLRVAGAAGSLLGVAVAVLVTRRRAATSD